MIFYILEEVARLLLQIMMMEKAVQEMIMKQRFQEMIMEQVVQNLELV